MAVRAAVHLGLTPRQQQIVELFLAQVTGPDAAAQLGITYATLKTHVRRLYRRLGVTNRAELLKVVEAAAEQVST